MKQRIYKTVTSTRLAELEKFKGLEVEITISTTKLATKNGKSAIKKAAKSKARAKPASKEKNPLQWLEELSGSCPDLPDGVEFQRKARKAWGWGK